MFVKVHKSYRTVVAICDSELLGKKFEEEFAHGTKQLDLRESFYKGDLVDHEKAVHILKTQAREDATFNIVGKKATQVALEAGIISKHGILHINKIPYALVLL